MEKGYAARITSYTNFDTNYLYWCALVRARRTPFQLYIQARICVALKYSER